MPEDLWDAGWLLGAGYGWIGFAALAPTAANPGVWAPWNQAPGGQNTYIVDIIVSSDTAMVLTVGYTNIQPGISHANPPLRGTMGSGGNVLFYSGVAAVPGGTTTLFTVPISVANQQRILFGNWLGFVASSALVVYTATVASNVSLYMFGWSF
jgi:hypothetical protein